MSRSKSRDRDRRDRSRGREKEKKGRGKERSRSRDKKAKERERSRSRDRKGKDKERSRSRKPKDAKETDKKAKEKERSRSRKPKDVKENGKKSPKKEERDKKAKADKQVSDSSKSRSRSKSDAGDGSSASPDRKDKGKKDKAGKKKDKKEKRSKKEKDRRDKKRPKKKERKDTKDKKAKKKKEEESSREGSKTSRSGSSETESGGESDEKKRELFFKQIDSQKAVIFKRLAEFIAIRSAWGDKGLGVEMAKAADWLRQEIEAVGGKAWLGQPDDPPQVADETPSKPVVVLAELSPVDPKKKTVLVYGRFGVRTARASDGWDADPWVLKEKDDMLYGRGVTSGKGPMMAWIALKRIYRELNRELPVNVKLLLEGTDEANAGIGAGLLVRKEARSGGFLAGIDHVVLADGAWLGPRKPCVIHGARGCAGFQLEVEGPLKDLDSGAHGGVVREPLLDCIHILTSLGGPDGEVLVKGLRELAHPPSDEERARCAAADFEPSEYCESAGIEEVAQLRFTSREPLLLHRVRHPCFSVQSCGPAAAASNDIALPRAANARFTFRLVPEMDPDSAETMVAQHVERSVRDLGSPNAVTLRAVEKSKPWLAEPKSVTVATMCEAVRLAWGTDPDVICEARPLPAAAILEAATRKTAVALPLGCLHTTAREANEGLQAKHFLTGIKVLGAFLELVPTLAAEGKK